MPDPSRPPLLAAWRAVAPLAAALAPLGRPLSPKLREGLEGRRGLFARAAAVAPALQGCVWFHATSVGEYEQARPVIAALRALPGAPPVAMTHFSPSGRHYAHRRPCADHHDYLPFDTERGGGRLLDLWRPRALVFVKFDCWPNLVLAAHARGVPLLLVAGTLQPRSARLRGPWRPLFRAVFDRFAALGVCTEADRDRFVHDLRVAAPVHVTGDTRADQVVSRWEAAAGGPVAAALAAWGGRRLVLGSTWPPDEAIWLPGLPALLDHHPDLRVVLVPHEPRPARLSDIEGRLARRGVPAARLSAFLAGDAAAAAVRCVVVDSVGVLAEIYRAGTLAYVGGSFTTGVHNTMEPAIASLPVLFGPVIQNAAEAGALVAAGAGFVVRRAGEALAAADGLLADPARLATAGAAAHAVVRAQQGATERTLALLRSHV